MCRAGLNAKTQPGLSPAIRKIQDLLKHTFFRKFICGAAPRVPLSVGIPFPFRSAIIKSLPDPVAFRFYCSILTCAKPTVPRSSPLGSDRRRASLPGPPLLAWVRPPFASPAHFPAHPPSKSLLPDMRHRERQSGRRSRWQQARDWHGSLSLHTELAFSSACQHIVCTLYAGFIFCALYSPSIWYLYIMGYSMHHPHYNVRTSTTHSSFQTVLL
jgi:hypothetical protein